MNLLTLLPIVIFVWSDVPFDVHYTDSETEIHIRSVESWVYKTNAPGVIHVRAWTGIKQPVNVSVYYFRRKVACTTWGEPSSYVELKYTYYPKEKPIKPCIE